MTTKVATDTPTADTPTADAPTTGGTPSRWLSRWLAVCGLALVGATWRLWTPHDAFPAVPLFAPGLPRWLAWPALAGMLAGLCGALVARPASVASRAALGLFVAATGLAVLLNQHRLQPWAWQFMLTATVLACSSGWRTVRLARWVTAGVYLHSGLSKLDRSFIESHGRLFVRVIGDLLGLPTEDWSDDVTGALALALPLGELAVAALLILWPRRRGWVWLSLPMHGALLVALGPWGLGHEAGVLLWNIYFIGQNLLLAPRPVKARPAEEPAAEPAGAGTRALAAVAVVLAVGMPFLEPWGLWDVWPSWAVYATAPEQIWFEVRGDAAARLPEHLQRYVAPGQRMTGADDTSWHRFRADHWSLDSVAAPLYPQARFQTAVGLAVARRYGLDDDIRAVALGRADRVTGQRWREVVTGRAAVERWAGRFLLNGDAAPPWSRRR